MVIDLKFKYCYPNGMFPKVVDVEAEYHREESTFYDVEGDTCNMGSIRQWAVIKSPTDLPKMEMEFLRRTVIRQGEIAHAERMRQLYPLVSDLEKRYGIQTT